MMQEDEPGVQNAGETQLVTSETEQCVSVYLIVCPEHEYAGVQVASTVTVVEAYEVQSVKYEVCARAKKVYVPEEEGVKV
jgi:hypothetical protein